jgi:hypothetical protein
VGVIHELVHDVDLGGNKFKKKKRKRKAEKAQLVVENADIIPVNSRSPVNTTTLEHGKLAIAGVEAAPNKDGDAAIWSGGGGGQLRDGAKPPIFPGGVTFDAAATHSASLRSSLSTRHQHRTTKTKRLVRVRNKTLSHGDSFSCHLVPND